ncbi:hypothetical protein DFP72DRAFT_816414 [Ephemerocybe angulata]|uniref:Uncharacterized protein n=1 Tax=Ephemerocybe angulata TaxID=980116 RepID=A0A8H6M364_9AGAR|nr:hypothetical protein DFP72DRAFT_816414 [Tulosesus angulatus]
MRPTLSSTILGATFAMVATMVMAVPIASLERRDVFSPPVIRPGAGEVWPKGTWQMVVWNTTNAPEQITNPVGKIVLRSVDKGRLLLDKPLATGFNILDGKYNLTVRNDIDAGQYQVVIMGDSGNWGPTFSVIDGSSFVDQTDSAS